jgi:hypothetical protein
MFVRGKRTPRYSRCKRERQIRIANAGGREMCCEGGGEPRPYREEINCCRIAKCVTRAGTSPAPTARKSTVAASRNVLRGRWQAPPLPRGNQLWPHRAMCYEGGGEPRPYREGPSPVSSSQGVALGYHIALLQSCPCCSGFLCCFGNFNLLPLKGLLYCRYLCAFLIKNQEGTPCQCYTTG